MKIAHIIAAMIASGSILGSVAYADNMTPSQKTEVEGVVHDYLIKNPEVIAESIQTLQKKQMDEMKVKTQEAAAQNASELFAHAGDPIGGNAKGKVTLVEFFDYQCPHCVDMSPDIQGIIKANPNLRVVFKEFPIRGSMSLLAAKAALAANLQGKYVVFHDALMKAGKDLTQDKIMSLASSVGLNVDKLKTDMNGSVVDQQIKANYKLAQALQLFGTPALFVARSDVEKKPSVAVIEFIPGQVNQQSLQDSINKVRA